MKKADVFEMTVLCREDLEDLGFNTKDISDETMKLIASDMAEAYLEGQFWSDLEILAEENNLTRRPINKT